MLLKLLTKNFQYFCKMKFINSNDTICAIATGGSISAIAVIRISGLNAIEIVNKIFSKDISKSKSHTIHFGTVRDQNKVIDEVLVSIFKNHRSYTGEESVEISCHGSVFIQQRIIHLLIKNGCRSAEPGEFTLRAFRNNKIDLSQAESVADLIASDSVSTHVTAMKQLRGGISKKLSVLRTELIDFASLIELELDFSEEDVEFANKNKLKQLLWKIKNEIEDLINSFEIGNAIKNGIPIVILGAPNVGKSTLLNCLVEDEKAIVSNIPGTTRDLIEDEIFLKGIKFRIVDTAGLRKTTDVIEKLGIEKSIKKAKKSSIIIYIIDPTQNINVQLEGLEKIKESTKSYIVTVVNKSDLNTKINTKLKDLAYISAIKNKGIDNLKNTIVNRINSKNKFSDKTTITNIRHVNELKLTLDEIDIIISGVENNITNDFLSSNIRQSLYHLGIITGEVTNDKILENIFGKFCIGK